MISNEMGFAIQAASYGLVTPAQFELLESEGMVEVGKLTQKAFSEYAEWFNANFIIVPDREAE